MEVQIRILPNLHLRRHRHKKWLLIRLPDLVATATKINDSSAAGMDGAILRIAAVPRYTKRGVNRLLAKSPDAVLNELYILPRSEFGHMLGHYIEDLSQLIEGE